MFNKLIDDLQLSAHGSASLLAELAGLETYIAETYTQRCLTELLQNSDDSMATKVCIYRENDDLIYLNNGNVFNENDFLSLCRSALSSKKRGESIGYRGIGFKSVVNICNSVIVASGELRCAFDRERTLSLLNTESKVPLIRVPHLLTSEELILSQSILDNKPEYTTCFIFRGLDEDSLGQEIGSLTNEHFLFLKSLLQIEIKTSDCAKSLSLTRNRPYDLALDRKPFEINNITISSFDSESSSSWTIVSNKDASIAFVTVDGLPSRLSSEKALLHSYLPTQQLSGTGARFNSDFSTDPSRTRLKYDELTDASIKSIASLILQLLHEYANDNHSPFWRQLVDTLIPYSNHKLLELQGNNFCGLLIRALSNLISSSDLCLNAIPVVFKDIEHLALGLPSEYCVYSPISSSYSEAKRFFDAIGIPPLPTNEIISLYKQESFAIDPKLSPLLIKNLLDDHVLPRDIATMNIFPSLEGASSKAADIINSQRSLDPTFVNSLSEKLMSSKRVKQFLEDTGFSSAEVEIFLPRPSKSVNSSTIGNNLNKKKDHLAVLEKIQADVPTRFLDDEAKKRYGIKDWRLAEELVAFHYRSQGLQVVDVSKANKGYDLEVITEDGRICVEIKKLGNPPASFSLTQNEFNESLFKGESFVLALVSSSHEQKIDIMFITNPYDTLSAFTTKRAKAYEFFVSGFAFVPSVSYE